MAAFTIFILALLAIFLVYYYDSSHKSYKNVIFIVADDLGWSDIGYGQSEAITPNINRLAKQSVILNQSYAYSMCTPSRNSFLTGLYAEHTGLQHFLILPQSTYGLPLTFELMPQYFKKYGYETHMVGKWHLGACNISYTPAQRGFDTFLGYFNGQEDYFSHKRMVALVDWFDLIGLDFWWQTPSKLDSISDKNGVYSTYTYNNRVVDVINSQKGDKPFFLYFASQNPHGAYLEVPQKYANMYPNTGNSNRSILLGMTSILDEVVGNITQALERNGLLDDTLIFFTSDNGGEISAYARNAPLRGGKLTAFEGGHRVRGFMFDKRIKPFSYNGMFHAVDWLPTMLGAALSKEINIEGVDGVNQYDAIRKQQSIRTSFIYNIDPLGNDGCSQSTEAIRSGDFKLIRGCPGVTTQWYDLVDFHPDFSIIDQGLLMNASASCAGSPANTTTSRTNYYFLFNVKEDPEEKRNLAAMYPCKVRDLEIELENYKKTSVPVLNPDPFGSNLSPQSDPNLYGGKWAPGWC